MVNFMVCVFDHKFLKYKNERNYYTPETIAVNILMFHINLFSVHLDAYGDLFPFHQQFFENMLFSDAY